MSCIRHTVARRPDKRSAIRRENNVKKILKRRYCWKLINCQNTTLVTLARGVTLAPSSRTRRTVMIKPSGVDYSVMTADDMVVVSFGGLVKSLKVIRNRRPIRQPTVCCTEAFPTIGIVHTHSRHATNTTQAGRKPIQRREPPCRLMTTGAIPALAK
ncbi:class II aldolase/adducin family protein [Salmonella enterica subsp. enterica]|nr:class II aldolase/adducin family protein [Salmonella enterica subsp. enterica]